LNDSNGGGLPTGDLLTAKSFGTFESLKNLVNTIWFRMGLALCTKVEN
jgi:hypothetical protein